MSTPTYLNLELVSVDSKIATNEESTKIIVLSAAKQLEQHDFNAGLTTRIKKAFAGKKNELIKYYENCCSVVVVLNSEETDSNRKLGVNLFQTLKKEEVSDSTLHGLNNLSETQSNYFLEGLLYGSYLFNPYKSKKEEVQVKVNIPENEYSKEGLKQLSNLIEGVSLTRTLINEPPNKLDSLKFSERMVEAGKKFGFETEVLHKDKIEELGMGGLLAVNQGSDIPPTFNIMRYQPKNAVNKRPLVLVGKGVTFDTGGYSLKTGGSMSSMKSDMGGAATVVGIIASIAANKLPYNIIALVPSTDNKINGKALLVDDVITTMDGTTVEVQNTDAEGRLILCDALSYAKRYDPELVIDMATLTGAAAAITGPFGIAMAGNQQQRMDKLKQSGETTYERLVQLPFWKEFGELLKSDVADIKNVGGPIGGATTAAKFLEHFTDYDWIHLDVAGAAFLKEGKGAQKSGGTGMGVRLLYDFIKLKAE